MNKQILIIDDDPAISEVVGLILESEGYKVYIRNTGSQASDFIKSHMPNLILLDIMLDGFDGRNICREIKHDDHIDHIPVIMFSASHNLEDLITGKQVCNAEAFIEKPFDIDGLLNIVEKHITV